MYTIERHHSESDIIVVTLSDELTLKDLEDLNHDVVDNFLTEEKIYGILYLLSNIKKYPSNISGIRQVSGPITSSDRIGLQVFLGNENAIFKFLVNVIGAIFKENIKRAESEEHAMELFAAERVSTT